MSIFAESLTMKKFIALLTVALLGFGAYAAVSETSAQPTPQNSSAQCPAAQGQCPAVQGKCPIAQGQCPAVQGQCPLAGTDKCPAVQGQCPAVQGKCPIAQGQCPAAQGQCPAVQGQCPLAGTDKCPAYSGDCPRFNAQGCANPNWQRTSRCGAPMRGKKAVPHHRRGKSPCWRFSFCN